MDNNELLNQIASSLEDQTQRMQEYVKDSLAAQTHKIDIKIENDVTRCIEALFDGYKLNYDKQWEADLKGMRFQRLIEDLQLRIAVIEAKLVG